MNGLAFDRIDQRHRLISPVDTGSQGPGRRSVATIIISRGFEVAPLCTPPGKAPEGSPRRQPALPSVSTPQRADDQPRGTVTVEIDRVTGDAACATEAGRLAGVRIDVVFRKIARRDVEPQPMSGLEQVRGRKRLDGDAHDLA